MLSLRRYWTKEYMVGDWFLKVSSILHNQKTGSKMAFLFSYLHPTLQTGSPLDSWMIFSPSGVGLRMGLMTAELGEAYWYLSLEHIFNIWYTCYKKTKIMKQNICLSTENDLLLTHDLINVWLFIYFIYFLLSLYYVFVK